MSRSRFIISLDFELHWGVFDHTPLDAAGQAYFLSTRELIPQLLQLFQQMEIRATWATVGFLFARSKQELLSILPKQRPQYQNKKLNPYPILKSSAVGQDEQADPFHFAPSLIEAVLSTPGQFIGSHTLSHYYCLEQGQDASSFAADLSVAQQLAKRNFGITLRSLVFPRNQFRPAYLSVVQEQQFHSIRTNPNIWFWQQQPDSGVSLLAQKTVRLADHYIPIDSHTPFDVHGDTPLRQVPASRLFRPYTPKLDAYGGQRLKINRIKKEMTKAAQESKHYHLWWHPHNLATQPKKNMEALGHILLHYRHLNQQYGMQSAAMEDV